MWIHPDVQNQVFELFKIGSHDGKTQLWLKTHLVNSASRMRVEYLFHYSIRGAVQWLLDRSTERLPFGTTALQTEMARMGNRNFNLRSLFSHSRGVGRDGEGALIRVRTRR